MNSLSSDKVWKARLKTIKPEIKEIRIPKFNTKQNNISQDEEWCEVCVNGKNKHIRFHDYGNVYEIPGLYEKIFYDNLKCCSPSFVVNLLGDVASDFGEDIDEFKVLDVGAGNGITVNADDVALTTPGTLTSATSNSAAGNHTHAITNYALSGTSPVVVSNSPKVLGSASAISVNAATTTTTGIAKLAYKSTSVTLGAGNQSMTVNNSQLYDNPIEIVLLTGNGAGTTLQEISSGTAGQVKIIIAQDSNTTVERGTGANDIRLASVAGADLSMSTGDTLTIVFDGTLWRETARSFAL